jgi:hypothetical protein
VHSPTCAPSLVRMGGGATFKPPPLIIMGTTLLLVGTIIMYFIPLGYLIIVLASK